MKWPWDDRRGKRKRKRRKGEDKREKEPKDKLQEMVRDREDWHVADNGVTKNQTWLGN